MEDLRFRSQQSPRNESPMNSLVSPPRNGTRLPQPVSPHDHRTNLPRRFTTDSGRVPTLSSITTAPQRGPAEPQEFPSQALHKVQLLEKKRIEYEKIREQKRRFEAEMQKLDLQQRREEQELAQMQEDLGRMGNSNNMSGHQSEPTTPPEYRETSTGFPGVFSRPNRYSMSSLMSPPGLYNRAGRSGSQLASPQSGVMRSSFAYDDQFPARSVPGSRRNSDDDDKEEAVRQDPTSHRATNAMNRYSMPVTKSRNGFYGDLNLDQNNTTRYLFGDDDSGDAKHYQVNTTNDNFPTLVRREDMLSASSVALDLAPSNTPGPDTPINTWANSIRHRHQQSLSTIGNSQINVPSSQGSISESSTVGVRPSSLRHSLDMKYLQDNSTEASPSVVSPPSTNHTLTTPPKLQSSFSANDVPTVKSSSSGSVMSGNANTHAQQHFHNHNASLGRIPPGAMLNRHSRELSNDNNVMGRESGGPFGSITSTLQASATPFGPGISQGPPQATVTTATSPTGPYSGYYNGQQTYNTNNNSAGYNMMSLSMSMQNVSLNGGSAYPPQNYTGYGGIYNQAPPGSQLRDSQARVIQNRRQMDNEAMNRYNGVPLEAHGGTIYDLCKDQHGCRYLQKQLENRNPDQIHMIWLETNQHVIELMTDPFGNYLCQKLLEYCNDDERTILIQNAAGDMVRIALNQHGTRALQKMIEFVNTPTQIQIIIDALRFRVVELIQDLNGNHVIQKCLNKLQPSDASFIFDAVGNHCVDVGTHRHGCCVLQRCIDHATGDQKMWLIQKITENAVQLVQDPFGNYVVQYIIDLNETSFTEPLVAQFRGRICQLSRHKFSSNVVEKCLRCSQDVSKDMMVEELLTPGEMDRLLRDSFANYVVQTALEYATHPMKHQLVEAIRPILPNIRSTPYGRRIQAKIQTHDSRSNTSSGQVTPADPTQGQIPLRPAHNRVLSNSTSILTTGAYQNGINGMNGAGRGQPQFPASHTLTVPPQAPRPGQYAPQYAREGVQPQTGSDWF